MHADDAASLLRFHHTLSPETTHLRFFAVHPELSEAELHRFTNVDHRDREAIVATVADEIVGVARFDRLEVSTDAEVAFVVADSWQGRGLGALSVRSSRGAGARGRHREVRRRDAPAQSADAGGVPPRRTSRVVGLQ